MTPHGQELLHEPRYVLSVGLLLGDGDLEISRIGIYGDHLSIAYQNQDLPDGWLVPPSVELSDDAGTFYRKAGGRLVRRRRPGDETSRTSIEGEWLFKPAPARWATRLTLRLSGKALEIPLHSDR